MYLVSSPEVIEILGVSRQRIQQMVKDHILPPIYVFNKRSDHKIFIFDKDTVMKFLNKESKKDVQWHEPLESPLMSIPELSEEIGCQASWIYTATRNEKIVPDLIVGKVCLYNKKKVQEVWDHRKDKRDRKDVVYRDSTNVLIEMIKTLHAEGLNDVEIAKRTNSHQPLIHKLRNEIGLESVVSRGRKKTKE